MSAPYDPNSGDPASAHHPSPDMAGPDFQAPAGAEAQGPPPADPYGQPAADPYGPPPADPYGPPPGPGQQPGAAPYGPPPPNPPVQPYAPPPAYGAGPAYGGGPAYVYGPSKQTNGMCIASLICGLGGLFTGLFLAGIAAVICGHKGMSQSKERGEEGHGLAIAGLITGYLQILGLLALIVLIVVAVVIGLNA